MNAKRITELYGPRSDNYIADHFLGAIVKLGSVFYMTFQYDSPVEFQNV